MGKVAERTLHGLEAGPWRHTEVGQRGGAGETHGRSHTGGTVRLEEGGVLPDGGGGGGAQHTGRQRLDGPLLGRRVLSRLAPSSRLGSDVAFRVPRSGRSRGGAGSPAAGSVGGGHCSRETRDAVARVPRREETQAADTGGGGWGEGVLHEGSIELGGVGLPGRCQDGTDASGSADARWVCAG